MKTIKVIDLLNKIANGEEVPKFKYDGLIWKYSDDNFYWSDSTYLDSYCDITQCLNDEVETLEEEKKIPEKLNLDTDKLRGKETPRTIDYLIEDKINEILDYLEEIEQKRKNK